MEESSYIKLLGQGLCDLEDEMNKALEPQGKTIQKLIPKWDEIITRVVANSAASFRELNEAVEAILDEAADAGIALSPGDVVCIEPLERRATNRPVNNPPGNFRFRM